MRHLLLALLSVFLALPVAAAEWRSCHTSHKQGNIVPGGAVQAAHHTVKACYDFDSDTNSHMLDVQNCENFDVYLFRDLAGNDNDGVTANIYGCGNSVDASGDGPEDAGWSSTGVCFLMENTTLTGTPPTGEGVRGTSAPYIYVDPQTITDDDARVVLQCYPRM